MAFADMYLNKVYKASAYLCQLARWVDNAFDMGSIPARA